jgi:hypothetical protein
MCYWDSSLQINFAATRFVAIWGITYLFYFICGLFNGAISSLDYMASNDRMISE